MQVIWSTVPSKTAFPIVQCTSLQHLYSREPTNSSSLHFEQEHLQKGKREIYKLIMVRIRSFLKQLHKLRMRVWYKTRLGPKDSVAF